MLREIGALEGYGEATCPDGEAHAGLWRAERLVTGPMTYEYGVFKGSFDDGGVLHGYGQHEHAGKVEQGLFEHGDATWLSAAS